MANNGNHTFIDGVGDVMLRDGVVRVDLLALSPTRRDKAENPVPEFVEQLVMSPSALVRMVQAMGETEKQMRDKDVIGSAVTTEADKKPVKKTTKPNKADKSTKPKEPTKPKKPKKPTKPKQSTSPNFK